MINVLGLNTRVPYHALFYSFVFGGSVFHSFVVSPIAFKVLPRQEFGRLQNHIFPGYFLGQTLAPLVLGLTTPLKLCPFSIGVLAVSGLAGALNYFVLLPSCQQIKVEREKLVADKKHEKNENGVSVPTKEYTELNKKFGFYHGISTLLNFGSIVTLGIYGLLLSKRMIK
ncbi:Piso0_005693 [Millerozyma farinosa CBS 7064]|uniref:Piso0_005693 protein n=1 Tax=Pichia sorbitophila (strain ATCC MYA-4447 / BCRC 22081 / CBS 7064 / NBRC 10061 / NRRL Y-12695) TaxID=559304 RepID=G8XZP3_PICSO|nr:Piso0_005693 [Millerozyma farinosa CBS 7064]